MFHKRYLILFISLSFLREAYTQSFVNPSLEFWGAPDTCYVNTAPNDWSDYSSSGGAGMDKIDFLLCPTTRPSNTTDGNKCGRMNGGTSSGEGMYQEILGFIVDSLYNLSFDYVGSNYLGNFSGQNQIHLFIDDIDVGQTPIFNTTDSLWNTYNFNFTATQLTHKIGIRLYKVSGLTANAAVDNFQLVLNNSTSINQYEVNENNVRLYPNPNNGTFTIEHNLNGNNYVLEIVDVMGNTVHHEIITNGNQQKIETKQLSSGIYFVKILNQQQQVSSHAKMSVVR